MMLPTTLTIAAGAALITIWHMMRIGKMRVSQKVLHGDGGDELIARRMRAQLNFVESAPFVLALLAGIELSGKGGNWLLAIGGIYLLGRVAHGIGMDAGESNILRAAGVIITMLTLLILAIAAVLIVANVI